MSHFEPTSDLHHTDTAPGDQRLTGAEIAEGIRSYLIGLGLATLLTAVSFFISGTTLIWEPSIPVALVVLAIAQMGVHLVFFLHITTGPDNVNNVMALAFGVLIVLLLLTGSLWIMANLNRNMVYQSETMQMQLESGPEFPAVTAIGVVAPAATTPVAARVPGVITSVHCDANTQVKAGEPCAAIDPGPYKIAADQSEADLKSAEAQLERDKANFAAKKAALERQEALSKRQAISRKVLDMSRKSLEAAQTQTEQDETKVADLKAALDTAKANLALTEILSPIDGTVVSRNVELGQTVGAKPETPPLFVIATDLTPIHIEATISAQDSSAIKLGTKATFAVPAYPNRQFSGMVMQIRPSPQTNEHVVTTDIVIIAPNPDLLLKPGMQATIRIVKE
jgi:HlyD family secretion protein